MLKSESGSQERLAVLPRKPDDGATEAEEIGLRIDFEQALEEPSLPGGELKRLTSFESARSLEKHRRKIDDILASSGL